MQPISLKMLNNDHKIIFVFFNCILSLVQMLKTYILICFIMMKIIITKPCVC